MDHTNHRSSHRKRRRSSPSRRSSSGAPPKKEETTTTVPQVQTPSPSLYIQNHAYGNTDKFPGVRPFLQEYSGKAWKESRIPLLPDYLFRGITETVSSTSVLSSSSSTLSSSITTSSSSDVIPTTGCDVLDIGCGYGYFSILLMERYGSTISLSTASSSSTKESSSSSLSLSSPSYIRSLTGIDISDTAIKRARTLLAYRQQEYLHNQVTISSSDHSSSSASASSSTTTTTPGPGFLPLSLRQVQKLPIKTALLHRSQSSSLSTSLLPTATTTDSSHSLPWYHRIHFRTENFIADTYTYAPSTYHLIFCCHVTKYIHLYNGDVGILLLFRKIYHILRSGGYLVLSIDPWEAYTNDARSFGKEVYAIYTNLRMKPDQFVPYLVKKVGFTLVERVRLAKESKGEDAENGKDSLPETSSSSSSLGYEMLILKK